MRKLPPGFNPGIHRRTAAPDRLGGVARTSAEQFLNSSKDIRAIAKSLRVDFVLEGSVRRQNDRIRATFQLIRASDQTHVWSESFDRDARDVFGLQSLLPIAWRTRWR